MIVYTFHVQLNKMARINDRKWFKHCKEFILRGNKCFECIRMIHIQTKVNNYIMRLRMKILSQTPNSLFKENDRKNLSIA